MGRGSRGLDSLGALQASRSLLLATGAPPPPGPDPTPGRLTSTLGCGEGRLGRELRERGHDVLGVEASPRLAAAAEAGRPTIRVLVADAAAIPLEDEHADIAVASMSLLNIEHLDVAMGEISRVLVPGGTLCFSTVHPLNSIEAARSVLGQAATSTSFALWKRESATVCA